MKQNEAAQLKRMLGGKIKFFRKKKGLSQAQLAEMVNIEMKSLSRIESGHNYPQCDNLVAISSALDVAPWQLYFCDSEPDIEKMRQDIVNSLDDKNALSALYQCLAAFK